MCWWAAAASATLWCCESKAQGRKAMQTQAATTAGVYTRAKRMTSVSMGDCSAAALLTSSAMRATVLSRASAVVSTYAGGHAGVLGVLADAAGMSCSRWARGLLPDATKGTQYPAAPQAPDAWRQLISASLPQQRRCHAALLVLCAPRGASPRC